jgi:diguanylate cyclase
MRILLIDDDTVDAMACVRALESAFPGAETELCDSSSRESMLARDTSTFDCILLDYALPGVTGSDMILALKERNRDLPPVVIVTGANDEGVVLESMRAGAEDYIGKDELTPSVVRRVVSSAIERSKLKKALRDRERRMEHLALHDELTGLGNRSLFQRSIERQVNAGQRGRGGFALLIIDLDGFKAVNDAHGHLAGDEMLRQTGIRLRDMSRVADMVFRVGGDEFAVLIDTGVSVEGLRVLSARISQWLSEPVTFGNASLNISASVGYAIYPTDGVSADDLFSVADAAMYGAKRRQE